MQADAQVTSEDDVKAYAKYLQDMKEYIRPYIGKKEVFGIDCGDIVGDTPSLYPSYINTVSSLKLPIYRAIGNHDMTYGGRTFEYSIILSKVISVPSIIHLIKEMHIISYSIIAFMSTVIINI